MEANSSKSLQKKRTNTNLWLRVFVQVIILDPTQEYAAGLLSVAEMFYANNIPLRFVFVTLGMNEYLFLNFLTY